MSIAVQESVTETHKFNPTILREYDIRGIVGETLNEADAYFVGKCFGTIIRRDGGRKVMVGYDGRHSSPKMADAICQGLISTGVDVDNIGMGPSPMLYFSVKDTMADGGIMITGSHNPSHYNGFKMMQLKKPLFGEAIKAFCDMAAAGDFEQGEGTLRSKDVKAAYVARLLKDYKPLEDLKVAWDPANGVGAAVLHDVVAGLQGEHILLNNTVDGDFPAHHPDPTVDKNLEQLIQTVKEQNCDLGISFDGDADRIGVVDHTGAIIRCDMLLAIYAQDILSRKVGAPVIGEVKCSTLLYDAIKDAGGEPIMWRTGHSHIKNHMQDANAPLAGELSGHIFFADNYYGYDDGLYAAIRLLNILDRSDNTLTKKRESFPEMVSMPEIRFDVEESRKFTLIDNIANDIGQNEEGNYTLTDIDGIRIDGPDGWALIRASNTQNSIVVRVEGRTEQALEDMKSLLTKYASKHGVAIPF